MSTIGKALRILSLKKYLYKEGDFCTNFTGGWEDKKLPYFSGSSTTATLTITSNADNVQVDSEYKSTNQPNRGNVYATVNAIDVSKYKTLYFDCAIAGSGNSSVFVTVFDPSVTYLKSDNAIAETQIKSSGTINPAVRQTYSLDITEATGSVDIGVRFYMYTSYPKAYLTIYNVWME